MSKINRCGLGLLALLLNLSAFATEAPKLAQQAGISTSGDGPYYRLNLPITIYQGAAHVDLRDVRIRNASGGPVPYAWLSNEKVEAQILSSATAFYPLVQRRNDAGPAGSDQPDVSLEFTQKPDGTLTLKTQRKPATKVEVDNTIDWIVDASQVKGYLLQARFVIADTAEGLFPLRIEGSDDLHHWHLINGEGQIAALRRPDGKVEKLTVDLHGSRAKFLRLHWQDATYAPKLKSVTLDSVLQNEVITPLQWTAPIAAATCSANSCDYSLPANTPLDSLRINLAETNTLAQITVLAQSPALVTRDYPRRHHPLYLLRHKRQSTTPAPAPTIESVLTQAVVYRLKQPNGEVHSDDMALDGGVYMRLRIQTQGPIKLLGQTAPTIEIATTPRSLLFLGRGSPPFSLHWGVDDQQESALPLTTLVPGYQSNKPPLADTATVNIVAAASGPTLAPALAQTPPVTKATTTPREAPTPGDKKWLWASLAAGLLILAGMAWSLFKGMSKPEQDASQ